MIAIDTNVLIYRFDRSEPVKQTIAKELLGTLAKEKNTVLLWQVAGELLSQLCYWEHQNLIERSDIEKILRDVRMLFPLAMPTPMCLDRAMELRVRHSLSHWDSMLVAACLESAITTLYSEDMGSPRKIESLQLENPFENLSAKT